MALLAVVRLTTGFTVLDLRMPAAQCDQCDHCFPVPANSAGQKVRCPQCDAFVRVAAAPVPGTIPVVLPAAIPVVMPVAMPNTERAAGCFNTLATAFGITICALIALLIFGCVFSLFIRVAPKPTSSQPSSLRGF
jgi:uncharacterized paraquat-inducible protein A